MLTVLLGGARSGKSSLAVRIGAAHDGPVTFIATSPRIAGDDDLARRIAAHRAERPSGWRTIEEQVDLAAALDGVGSGLVIVDCLTMWVGNLLHRGEDEDEVRDASRDALAVALARSSPVVAISNEVGLGIVPANRLARSYRDVLGRVNQEWAAAADHALFMVAGRAVALADPEDLLR